MTPTTTEVQALIEQHLQGLTHLYGLLNLSRPTGEQLTARELEILTLRVSTPLTMRQIGRRMHLSENTVKSAAKVAWRKLGVTDSFYLKAALARLDEVSA